MHCRKFCHGLFSLSLKGTFWKQTEKWLILSKNVKAVWWLVACFEGRSGLQLGQWPSGKNKMDWWIRDECYARKVSTEEQKVCRVLIELQNSFGKNAFLAKYFMTICRYNVDNFTPSKNVLKFSTCFLAFYRRHSVINC